MFGPHLYFDLVRLARRGRSTAVRVGYIGLLFLTLYLAAPAASHRINDFARAARDFAYPLFVVQYAIVFVLTPIYFGSAIAEENRQRTIELLFMSPLDEWEIVLGKLFSR